MGEYWPLSRAAPICPQTLFIPRLNLTADSATSSSTRYCESVIQQIYDCTDGWPPVFRGRRLKRIRGGPSPELLVDNLNEHVQALVTGQPVDELLINDLTEHLMRITLWLAGELEEPPTLLRHWRPLPPPPPPANPPPSTPAVQSPPAQASPPSQNRPPPTAPGPSPPQGAHRGRRANGEIIQQKRAKNKRNKR